MPGKLTVVFGSQWGDEGKGKVGDEFAEAAHFGVRPNGGPNAGHTVVVGDERYKFNLITESILRAKPSIIGSGTAINLVTLFDEDIPRLRKAGVEVEPGLLSIADNAHVIPPYAIALDEARESASGANAIGTTKRGVGPTFERKAARRGLRISDVLDSGSLRDKVERDLEEVNWLLGHYNHEAFDASMVADELARRGDMVRPYARNVGELIARLLDDGKDGLVVNAHGMFLDIDLGTYPYVTLANPRPAASHPLA